VRLCELDLWKEFRVSQSGRLFDLLIGEVDPHGMSRLPDLHRGPKDVGAGPGAEIQDLLARLERRKVEVIAHSRK
jgi:hypothetical protein